MLKETDAVPEREFFTSRGLKKGRAPKKIIVSTPKPVPGKGNVYQYTRTGFREDLKIVLRSNWEANVCRVFNLYGIQFEFEPRVFVYPIKRGTKGYTCDFYLNATDEWVEVKGYLDDKSRTKIKRFKKYYPDEFSRFTMIISKSSRPAREFCEQLGVPQVLYYEQISKLYKQKLPNWEGI